jgi:hypothetical protein
MPSGVNILRSNPAENAALDGVADRGQSRPGGRGLRIARVRTVERDAQDRAASYLVDGDTYMALLKQVFGHGKGH